jgi:hypothetical protein
MTTERRVSAWTRRALQLMATTVFVVAQPAAAVAPELQITLQPTQRLQRDAHTAIPVTVQLPRGSADLPLLLTPRIEGAAVELVRGRLLRSDAKQMDPEHLRFEIPVVARSEGTAILRVSLTTYVCDDSCRRVEVATSAVLEVR